MLTDHRLAPAPMRQVVADQDLAKRVRIYLVNVRNELRVLKANAKGGIVRLSGTVPTFYLRQLAVACAKRVAGVHGVVDELEVEYAENFPLPGRSVSRELASI